MREFKMDIWPPSPIMNPAFSTQPLNPARYQYLLRRPSAVFEEQVEVSFNKTEVCVVVCMTWLATQRPACCAELS